MKAHKNRLKKNLKKDLNSYVSKDVLNKSEPEDFRLFALITGFILSAVVIGEYLINYLGFLGDFSKWLPFFVLGVTVPLTFFVNQIGSRFSENKRQRICNKYLMRLLWSLISALIITVIYGAIKNFWRQLPTNSTLWMFFLMGSFTIITTLIILQKANLYTNQKISKLILCNLKLESIIFFLLIITWSSLFQLPNSHALQSHFYQEAVGTTLASIICFIMALASVFPQGLRQKDVIIKSTKPNFNHVMFFIILPIFLFLGFRSDTLFIFEGAQFHWAYFVGPIQTTRAGGWLLWNTPSQYGFLNFLLPSLLPTKTAWQAIYVFQGGLLTIASFLMFKIIINNTQNFFRLFIGLLITISALYFADPVLEGPYLFPSSSVMRFFWCYVFLFLLFNYWKNLEYSLNKLVLYGSICWVFAVLWSSESALYASCTFYPALFMGCLKEKFSIDEEGHHRSSFSWKKMFLKMLVPMGMLVITALLIKLYYFIFLGHLPDWQMFSLHGFLYAAGFGAYPMDRTGSVWMLLLLFISLVILANSALKKNFDRSIVPLSGLIGCLWGISSYFVGRAVPNNITAILPILVTIGIFAVHIASVLEQSIQRSFIQRVVTLPFIFIVLITTVGNPNLFTSLNYFKTFSSNIESHVPSAENNLLVLMQSAGVSLNDPIVYSGNLGLLPSINDDYQVQTSERTWLPIPLQLLEEPIPEEKRNQIIERFILKKQQGGYLIHKKGDVDNRYESWLKLLDNYFYQIGKWENDGWIILHFEPKKGAGLMDAPKSN